MKENILKFVKIFLVIIIAGFIVSFVYIGLTNESVKLPNVSGNDYGYLEDMIYDLENRINGLESQIEDIEWMAYNNESNISDLEYNIEDNEYNISDLEYTVYDNENEIRKLKNRVDDLEWDINYQRKKGCNEK